MYHKTPLISILYLYSFIMILIYIIQRVREITYKQYTVYYLSWRTSPPFLFYKYLFFFFLWGGCSLNTSFIDDTNADNVYLYIISYNKK